MDYDLSARIADDYQSARRPNVLVIMTDQQAYDTIGVYGNRVIRTPNIDRLAREGVLFERTYTTCPLCAPARSSILSGLHVHSSGVPVNDDDARMICLGDNIETFGDVFKLHGYTCAYFGKWHIGREGTPQHGFVDAWWTHLRNSYENWLESSGQFEFPDKVTGLQRRGLVPYELAHDTQVTNRAIEFMERCANRPFLCFCSLRAPHDPYIGPFDNQYDPADVPLPSTMADDLMQKPFSQRICWGRKEAKQSRIDNRDELRRLIARYWGLVHLVDVNVGRIIDALERKQILDDTLIMFVVDHGDMMGAHGLLMKGPFMYEETNRVPMIIRYPHSIPRNTRCSELTSLVDCAPTLIEYAGLCMPPAMQGRSLKALIDQQSGDGRSVHWRDAVFSESYESYTQRAPIWNCTTRDWKYNHYFGDMDELYNLAEDPAEMDNLASDPGHRQILYEMRDRLRDWAERTRAYSMGDLVGLSGHMITPGQGFEFDRYAVSLDT